MHKKQGTSPFSPSLRPLHALFLSAKYHGRLLAETHGRYVVHAGARRPHLLSGRRFGGDLCILAYKAIGNANICATLYIGDQRMFGAP